MKKIYYNILLDDFFTENRNFQTKIKVLWVRSF